MSRWPVAGPSDYWLIASSPAPKVKQQYTHSTTNTHKMTAIRTRQLQQYTQDNYNNTHIVQQIHIRWQQYAQDNYSNTHKTTTTIHTRQLTTIRTRQLQQYTQDNYSNTHKTTTTIHTRQLTTIHTRHLKIQHVQKINNTKVRKRSIRHVYFEDVSRGLEGLRGIMYEVGAWIQLAPDKILSWVSVNTVINLGTAVAQ